MATKGRFVPTNPQKYMGNAAQIVFRSSWELTVMKFFDKSTGVRRWGSEEIVVPYISPKDGRMHRYYPDFFVELVNAQQVVEQWIIEVKPLKETAYEHAKTAYDKMAVAINEAKWKATEKFCAANGLKFKVITELNIFKMAPPKTKVVKPRVAKAPKKPKPPKKLNTTKKTIKTSNTTTRKTK